MSAGKLPLMVDANPLLGTWKLKAYVVTTAAGERATPYGENPTGYLSYSADGRMQVIAAAKGRIAPVSAAPPENERVALYDTMFAYAARTPWRPARWSTTSRFHGTKPGLVRIKFDSSR